MQSASIWGGWGNPPPPLPLQLDVYTLEVPILKHINFDFAAGWVMQSTCKGR